MHSSPAPSRPPAPHPPGRDEAVSSLARVLGEHEADGTWRAACRDCGVPQFRPLRPDEFLRVAEHLAARRDAAGCMARALVVRARVSVLLAGRGAPPPAPAR